MSNNTGRRSSIEDRSSIIEERITKVDGEVVIKRFSKGRFLGKGGFARCYEFTNQETRKITACKIIPKASLAKARAKQKLMFEIKIHRSIHHRNIVGFEHFFEDHDNVYILLELCSNQTLNEMLRRRKRLSELETQCYGLQIVSALQYLHAHRVIHRDLKLGNLFLNDKMEVKLGDFGLATKLEFEGERKRTICGTPNYIAPEVLDGKKGHSYEADVWSLGVVIYTMLVGKPPFETSDVKTTYRRIRMNAFTLPDHLSEPAKSLISEILVNDPSKRIPLDDIPYHEFFNQGYPIPATMPPSTLACPLPTSSVPDSRLNDTAPVGSPGRLRNSTGSKTDRTVRPPLALTGEIWVQTWVDYSSKYGLGYILSNGSIGVFFNDSTKLIVSPDGNLCKYYQRRTADKMDEGVSFNIEQFPAELEKKMNLLKLFKQNLGECEVLSNNETEVYVKKWMRTRHAIMFRLSNQLVQVNFQDKTEILLNSETKIVTYLDKRGERTTYPLATALESTNQEMTKRLNYAKEILSSPEHKQ